MEKISPKTASKCCLKLKIDILTETNCDLWVHYCYYFSFEKRQGLLINAQLIKLLKVVFYFKLKEAVQLSDKLHLFNSKFYHEFDGVDIFCQKLNLLALGAF